MSEEFNKNILFDNIYYLIKKQDRKIGEVENAIGVSSGYISRTSKDGGKPGIEFIINIAKELKVSIDALLKIDLSALTPTERYILSFIEKLISDTREDKIEWNKETPKYLRQVAMDMNGNTDHALFTYQSFIDDNGYESPDLSSPAVFFSKSFGEKTQIFGNCYNLRLKNNTYLYIMDISSGRNKDEPLEFAREVWISSRGDKQYLCTTNDKAELKYIIDILYETVEESMKHPKIKSNLKESMDAFMNDDLEDDDGGLPFNF